MSLVDDRIDLIRELASFPGLDEIEVGLLYVSTKNVERVQQPMTLKERIDSAIAFEELGFRLDRIKRRIEGGNVRVFNPRRMQVRGPRMAKVRALG